MMGRHGRFIALLALLLVLGCASTASADWRTPEALGTDQLQDWAAELEDAIATARENQAAHPSFLDYLEELHGQLLQLLEADADQPLWGEFPEEAPEEALLTTEKHRAGGVEFAMVAAPAAVFPAGIDDSDRGEVQTDFWIGETQVTYELWYAVRQWAQDNGYAFANAGREGSHGEIGQRPSSQANVPVAEISWRDAVVWCNALSEMLGFEPVYRYQGSVVRDAGDGEACDGAVLIEADGFRLPASEEWELAARYRGDDGFQGAVELDGRHWTPGRYASGAVEDTNDDAATTAVAWYPENSGNALQPVAGLRANPLGLYDMSGNGPELTFSFEGSRIIVRGGRVDRSSMYLQIGREQMVGTNSTGQNTIRLVRSAEH